jgi:hypothetical protein
MDMAGRACFTAEAHSESCALSAAKRAQICALRGRPITLCDLGDRRAAAAGCSLYRAPRLPCADHTCDPGVSLGILRPSFVATFRLGLGLPLRLSAAPVGVVFASNGGEHVEQHTVDGLKHPTGEFVCRFCGHHPRGGQIQRNDADPARCQFGFETFPVFRDQARQAVDLLDQQHVAGMGVGKQPKEFWTRQLGSTLVFDVPGGNGKPSLGRERLQLLTGAICVLVRC